VKGKQLKDFLAKVRKRFDRAVEADVKNRENMIDDLNFFIGEQWPPEIKRRREQDPDGPRPCLTINKIPQFVRQVTNDQRQNRPAIKVHPVDSAGDPETAEVIQGIIRNIEDVSKADIAYDTAFESAVKIGIGYFRVITDFTDENSFDQDIYVKHIPNAFSVYFDPDSLLPDGSDSNWCFITEMMGKEEFEDMYPDADLTEFGNIGRGDSYKNWYGEETVRVAEYFEKTSENEVLVLLSDGRTVLEKDIKKYESLGLSVVKNRKTKIEKIKWYKLTGDDVLDEKEWAGIFIPVIPVIGNEDNIEGEKVRSGIIRNAKDPQRMYNFWRTSATEMIALAPKAPFIAAEGQMEGHEEEWKSANIVNRAVLTYKPTSLSGQMAPPPQRNPYPGDPMGISSEAQIAEHDIQTTIGIYNASLGERSNERSGRAILARQKEGDTSTYHYIDNLNKSIRHCGRIIVDLIPKIYDTKRIARILGDEGTKEPVSLDPDQQQSKQQVQTVTGIETVYNLGMGKYDVTISSGPSYQTRRQESVEAMLQMTQANPQLMQFIGDLMVKSMDWPGADEIANRLRKMLPPQLQDENKDIPPQAQQQIQQLTQQVQQLDHVIQQMTQEMDILKQKKDEKMAELQMKGQISQQEKQMEAEKINHDYELAVAKLQAEIQLEREKANAEIQLMREKAIAEIEAKKEIAIINANADVNIAHHKNLADTAMHDSETKRESASPKEEKEPVMPVINIHMPNSKKKVKMTRMPDGSMMGEQIE